MFRAAGWFTGTALSINVMTLGGIAVALGELVDDAVVDVENILRRLKQNRASAHPQPVRDVVLRASVEVRSGIVYATIIEIVAVVPILFLEGLSGAVQASTSSGDIRAEDVNAGANAVFLART